MILLIIAVFSQKRPCILSVKQRLSPPSTHFQRSFDLKPAVQKIGWFVTAARIFERVEGSVVLLVHTAVSRIIPGKDPHVVLEFQNVFGFKMPRGGHRGPSCGAGSPRCPRRKKGRRSPAWRVEGVERCPPGGVLLGPRMAGDNKNMEIPLRYNKAYLSLIHI